MATYENKSRFSKWDCFGTTLLFGSGVVSADEVTSPSSDNVASAQTNDSKRFVVDNGLTKKSLKDAKKCRIASRERTYEKHWYS